MSNYAERFWKKVDKSGECWNWTAMRSAGGYGRFLLDDKVRGAHRVAWSLCFGTPVPSDMDCLHRCDNPSCVNPAHLFLGTAADNIADMIQKGRFVSSHAAKTHCPKGHEYNAVNTYTWDGRERHCRACRRANEQGRRNRMRAAA